MGIFSEFAPQYWEVGLPVMPLKVRDKRPILNEWSAYCTHFPSQAVREHWLESYPNSNIGLPLGGASGLCMVDIDTDDEELVEAIMDILPASPWKRVGKKGCALAFKWQGQRTFRIRSDAGMICEFLAEGTQLVLPPSIHPDTGAPYSANCDLWDVMDKIQPLGLDIEERLRAALGVRGVSLAHEGRSAPMIVVPQGERDIQLVRHAGYLARVVLGIDKNAQFSLAAAMQHMHTWVEQFTIGVAGDDMDPDKGVAKLIEFLLKDVESGKTMPNGWDVGLTTEQLVHPSIVAMAAKNEIARWTRSKAREWMSDQIGDRVDDDDWVLDRVETLVGLIAKDDQFTAMQSEAVFEDVKKKYGKVIGKPGWDRAFRAARAGDTAEADEDHEAIARRVLDMINRDGEVRYSNGMFWQWNGSCFKELSGDAIYERVTSIKGNVLSRRHADYMALVKVIGILASRDLIEADVCGVNFANGFLDMEGVLHEHAPRFGKTFTMPFNYAPERANEAHKWFAFLERVWGDDPDYAEKVAALQEAFASTMFGTAPKYQRVILLYGQAGTGKSTIMNVLKAMMPPEAVCSVPPQKWSQRFTLVRMIGKSLNCCGELSETDPIDGATFKSVIEGDSQEIEFKGRDMFSFKPRVANWFASNFLPISRDGSKGFLRRWLVLYFGNPVTGGEVVRDYHDVLVSEEREAIAAWAVQGIKRLERESDYTLPPSHHDHLNSVRRANNNVAAWLESNGKIVAVDDRTKCVDAMEAYDHFRWHMKDVAGMHSNRIMNLERFRQMLDELGHKTEEYHDTLSVKRFKILGMLSTVPTVSAVA